LFCESPFTARAKDGKKFLHTPIVLKTVDRGQ
jgi:hypothetical protein